MRDVLDFGYEIVAKIDGLDFWLQVTSMSLSSGIVTEMGIRSCRVPLVFRYRYGSGRRPRDFRDPQGLLFW